MNSINQFVQKNIPKSILEKFNSGNQRTRKARKHVVLSYFYKFGDIALGFVQVPLVLTYIGEERYGIWLILFSITEYFNFMDVGLDKGLRNKFTESKAKGEYEKLRYYVSTTYASVGIISIMFFIVFSIVSPLLDWSRILNTSKDFEKELFILSFFVFGSFSLRYVLKIIVTIVTADQKPSIKNIKTFLVRLVNITVLVLLMYTSEGSLLKVGIGLSSVPVIVLVFLSFYFYRHIYRYVKPSLYYVDFRYLKDIMNVGIYFFIISVAAVVLFTTDNLIITQLYSPAEVTQYQIAHKYFNVPLMLFMIILQPLWSSVNDAYHSNDLPWIRSTILQLRKYWLLFSIITLFMLGISPVVFKVWLGNKVTIPIALSLSWVVFIIVQLYNAIFTQFVNGTGKLQIQLILAISSIILNIPLSIFLAKYVGMGVSGVITATTFSMVLNSLLKTVQYNKIMNSTATGIWNR